MRMCVALREHWLYIGEHRMEHRLQLQTC